MIKQKEQVDRYDCGLMKIIETFRYAPLLLRPLLPLFLPLLLLMAAAAVKSAEDSASAAIVPELITIEAGSFIKGSDRAERELGYQLDENAYKHSATRTGRWYEREPERQTVSTSAFRIGKTPVTNRQYAEFVKDTGRVAPTMDAATWAGYRLIHPFSRAQRFIWPDGEVPAGREEHPVVLVSYHDAVAYADWLSMKTGESWRLPHLHEWERAARGDDGRIFPWGNEFDSGSLNSHDQGPFDTQAVGLYPEGASPHGLLDAAGQVFEWIETDESQKRGWLKGGSWDDKGCGVCRPAARHARPKSIRHILVGFRVVQDLN